jgi:hypothetical protein
MDINEITGQPQEQNEHEDAPKGVNLFIGEEDIAFYTEVGREVTEHFLQESFLLYRVDLQKISPNLYGESKKKPFRPPVEVFGRLDIESVPVSYQVPGGIMKRGQGSMTAHVYLEHLTELGLLIRRDGQHVRLDLKVGDYIMFKGQYFEIKDDGFSQLNNEFAYVGDRRFYVTIKAVEVDEDRFRAR